MGNMCGSTSAEDTTEKKPGFGRLTFLEIKKGEAPKFVETCAGDAFQVRMALLPDRIIRIDSQSMMMTTTDLLPA